MDIRVERSEGPKRRTKRTLVIVDPMSISTVRKISFDSNIPIGSPGNTAVDAAELIDRRMYCAATLRGLAS